MSNILSLESVELISSASSGIHEKYHYHNCTDPYTRCIMNGHFAYWKRLDFVAIKIGKFVFN